MLNDIDQETLDKAELLLETYYLEQLIEISNLSEIEVLAILLTTGDLELPEVLPL